MLDVKLGSAEIGTILKNPSLQQLNVAGDKPLDFMNVLLSSLSEHTGLEEIHFPNTPGKGVDSL